MRLGCAPPRIYSDREVSIYLGMNAEDMWNAFMPGLPQALKQFASERIGSEMVRLIKQGEAVLYDGVPAMLDELTAQGHTLVFLSNCKHAYQQAHRAYFGLDQWFSGYFCCENYENRPKEAIFPSIKARFGGPYVVIGDRASDFRVASVHGLRSIGCGYGFGTREELALADVVVQSCKEIPRLILSNSLSEE